MWKSIFYNVIAKVDGFESKDDNKEEFYKLTNEICDDILSLQLALVGHQQQTCQYGAAHLISFALTAYCDERLNLFALSFGCEYQMLQTRLFNTVSAGKIFYEYLEYMLAEPTQIIHTYWAYYYILMHGYKGMYDLDSHFQRNLYLRQLKLLVNDKTTSIKDEPRKKTKLGIKIASVMPISVYWAVPALCLVTIYAAINFL